MEENIKSKITLGTVTQYINWLINNNIDEFGRPVIIAEVYRLTGMKVLLQTAGLAIMRVTESQIRVGNSIGKHMDFSLLHYAAWYAEINGNSSVSPSEVEEVFVAAAKGPIVETPHRNDLSEEELMGSANPLLVKVFSLRADELERTLQDWFVQNPGIVIKKWSQSATTQDYRVCALLTIVYTEG